MSNTLVDHFDKVSKNWVKIVDFLFIAHFRPICHFWVRMLYQTLEETFFEIFF